MLNRNLETHFYSEELFGVTAKGGLSDDMYSRQTVIPGFDQEKLRQACIFLIGGGGINSETGLAFAKRGVGNILVADPDKVEFSNLTRQHYFPEDVGKSKAHCLIQHLALASTAPEFNALGAFSDFESFREHHADIQCDVWVAGVDRDLARLSIARHGIQSQTPVVFIGLGRSASTGYVFVQTGSRNDACWGCLFPSNARQALEGFDNSPGCAPALIECAKATAAWAVYAVDSLMMDRPRPWNYRCLSLSGLEPDAFAVVPVRETCPLHMALSAPEGSGA